MNGAQTHGEPVLVLGATSLVGRFLLPRLAAANTPATALSRNPPDSLSFPSLDWISGEVGDPSLAERLPAAATVFSLMPLWLLPEVLPGLAERGVARLVAFSSTSRFTKTRSPDPAERAVAQRLADAEEAVIATCGRAGVAWTLLRPTLIYAEGQDGNVSRLAQLIRRFGVLPLAGQGEGLRQPVHADDLAGAALAVAESSAAKNRAYDLPGGETLSYREMAARIFMALDRPVRILSVPPALWTAGLRLAAPLLPGATAGMGARMAEDLTFDASAAARDFGWSPRPFRPEFGSPHLSRPGRGMLMQRPRPRRA